MNNLRIKVGLIFLAFLIAVHTVSAFGGAITPPKIAVKVNASDIPQKVTVTLRIYNTNNYPVKISLIPQGEINSSSLSTDFSKNGFLMNAGAKEDINVSFNVKKAGSYNGSIIVKFEKVGNNPKHGSYLKTSLAFPVGVEVKTTGKERGIPGFFAIYSIVAIVILALFRRKTKK